MVAVGCAVLGVMASLAALAIVTWPGIAWGTVGEWVAGVGTLLALVVSFWLLGHDIQDRRRDRVDREHQQARLVSCWVTLTEDRMPCVLVRND
jgi:4-hydroxybenzoate polyprenyltransferase